jgi:DMSO/TMAO reductase YedYZ molybdopterin-dependent catalytic subunit
MIASAFGNAMVFGCILALLTGGCRQRGGPPGEQLADSSPLELRVFEGQRLSSRDDFRENSIKGPQEIAQESYRLKVGGLVRVPRSYSYAQLLGEFQAHKKVVKLHCVEGWSVKVLWEGFPVRELLERASPLEGAKVAIFRAQDGYSTSFPLEYLMKQDILLAYRMNGEPLLKERGFPLQLVAEGKWGYKWIKWVREIEISDDVNYRGYWETRGYSNSGDLDESPAEG